MDSARFQTVFDLRDRIKSEAGVGASCERLTGLNTETPGDPAIQLNLGIALFESGRIPEAMPIFQNLVADAKEMLPGVWLEKAVFYLGLCQLPLSAEEAIKSVATSLGLVSDEGKKNLINLTVDRLVNTKSIAFLLRTLDPAQWAGNVGPAQARRLFELASAAGIAELFDEFSKTVLREMDEAHLIPLMFRPINNLHWLIGLAKLCHGALDPAQLGKPTREQDWLGRLRSALSAASACKASESTANIALSPADAYRVGHQALGRLKFEEAEFVLLRLTADSKHWRCLRLLAQLYESTGDRDKALKLYHRATIAELEERQLSTDAIRTVAVEDAKVSCIAISYNDAVLVPTFCEAIMPHCDEIIVNDGGSTDGTIEAFEHFGREHGFPVMVIRDSQKRNRDRSLATKTDYRKKGFGGVLGFEADRRRTTTLLVAQHPYILLADLDDYFPPFPNCKTLVASSFGVDHFVGSKCELLTADEFCDLRQLPDSQLPTLFRRDRTHYFGGPAREDEYLARLDKGVDELASHFMPLHVSYCYSFWHLKNILDPSFRDLVAPELGPRSLVAARADRPDRDLLIQLERICEESRREAQAAAEAARSGIPSIKPVSPEDIVVSATDPAVGSHVGIRRGGCIVAVNCSSGYVAFGPHTTLAPGNWIAGVHLDTDSSRLGSVTIDVCSGFGTVIHASHKVELSRMPEDERSLYFPFFLQHECHNVEVRLAIESLATVSVESLSLSRTPLSVSSITP